MLSRMFSIILSVVRVLFLRSLGAWLRFRSEVRTPRSCGSWSTVCGRSFPDFEMHGNCTERRSGNKEDGVIIWSRGPSASAGWFSHDAISSCPSGAGCYPTICDWWELWSPSSLIACRSECSRQFHLLQGSLSALVLVSRRINSAFLSCRGLGAS